MLLFGPLHIIGDATVALEHCEISKMVDTVADIASLDYGLIADRGVALSIDVGMNY